MPTTVIGVFEPDTVGKVTKELVKAGFAERDLDIIEGPQGEIVSAIVSRGYEPDDAQAFARAAKAGRKLLAASAPAARVDKAVEVMERFEVDIDAEEDQEEDADEQTVPVVEEELSAGKHKVARGGVRVTSRVEERPVEASVRLREEHVEAERRPVDRPLRAGEAETVFQDRTIEMTETAEELEVGKEARVVEEIALTKRTAEREQKIKDTVRRTEVDVEEIGSARRKK
jgi:uncharacterized protein (TIGR02271 family)